MKFVLVFFCVFHFQISGSESRMNNASIRNTGPGIQDIVPSPIPNSPRAVSHSKSFFRFGDQLITLEKQGDNETGAYMLVSLHSNEVDAIKTTMQFAQDKRVDFLRLMNRDKKNVEAIFLDKQISFDPNSIFTKWGRRACLLSNKYLDKITNMKIRQFAQFMLNEMPEAETIVTIHTESTYTINHYIGRGSGAGSVKRIFKTSDMRPSSYFLTTSTEIFDALEKKNCNVVLLHKKKAKDDGSLSIYCVHTGRPYVSVETGAADPRAQELMLETIHEVLK
jgi:hypothetical protein